MSIISKRLTAEELQAIKDIKQEYTNLALTLGELELQKNAIEKQKVQLSTIQDQLYEKEIKLVSEITEKYGKGSINMETGEIS